VAVGGRADDLDARVRLEKPDGCVPKRVIVVS
jgi:hypothetical protein